MLDWLVYPLLLTCVVAFYGLVGLPFAAIIARRSRPMLCLAPIFGFSVLAIAGSWFALLEQPMSRPALLLVTAILAGTGIAILFREYLRVRSRQPDRGARAIALPIARLGAIVLSPWLVAITALTVFIVPVVTTDLLAGGFVTSFSALNVDLASYILQATNLEQAGFGPTLLLADPDLMSAGSLGDVARYDHTGASSILATTAVAFGVPVWKIASVAVLAAAAAILPAAYVFAYQVLRLRLRWCLVASAAGSLTVYLWYITSQMFYAQILAIGLVLAQLTIFCWAARAGRVWPMVTLAPLPIAAAWFCSPEVEIVAGFLVCVAVFVGLTQRSVVELRNRNVVFLWRYLGLIGWVAVAFCVSMVLAVPRVKGAVDVLMSVGKDDVAGWKLNLLGSGSVLLGLDGRASATDVNSQLQTVTGADHLAWFLVGAAIVCVGVLALARRERESVSGLLLFAAIAMVGALGQIRWGSEAYQTWKLVMTLSFALLTLAAAIWLRILKTEVARQLVIAILMTLVGMSLVNGQHTWDYILASQPTMRSRIISPELVGLLRSPFLQRQVGANMKMTDMFETMTATAVYDRQAEMSAPAYFSHEDPDGQGYPFACTVMSKSLQTPRQLLGARVVKETQNYIVLGTKDCR